jgi:hypothetical protein
MGKSGRPGGRSYDPLDHLRRTGRLIAEHERALEALRVTRDDAIADLRERGVSWGDLASAAGVSRAALIKRRSAGS